jgi:hypothetical protein
MGDEILKILTEQLKENKVKLLHDQRMEAFKFLNSAYNYTGNRQDETFDAWEFKILFGMNHAVGLSSKAKRDELRTELAFARDVMNIRLASNPDTTDAERRIFEMVESFKVEV